MLKTGMYVRCSIDTEDPNEPRDFISGKILEINEFAETAKVMFYDILGLRKYYQVSQTLEFPLSKLCHCKINNGSLAKYNDELYRVLQFIKDKNEDFIYYYLVLL